MESVQERAAWVAEGVEVWKARASASSQRAHPDMR
ncbi:hypothetical protein OCAE111667_14465 [Occultella aeris]|uniref:Uncharacterized protein n=1 Tax=Occultella aeris TaxID=2761496 RepID=A0A7M4DIN4_9MICO|nr:hypothetical protein HALOF300_01987 [Occultella aeris]